MSNKIEKKHLKNKIMKKKRLVLGYFGVLYMCMLFPMQLLGKEHRPGGCDDVVGGISPTPSIKVKKSKQKMDYPGVYGAPIMQSFFVWISVDCVPKELKDGKWQNLLELDSFYWRGYRGLGSHGKNGAEVKSLFTGGAFTAINRGVYESKKSEDSVTQGDWLLIFGYLELYPNNLDDSRRMSDDLPHMPVQVPYKDGDPDLQLFYHWKLAEFDKKKGCGCWWKSLFRGNAVSEVIKIQKVEKTVSVMHP